AGESMLSQAQDMSAMMEFFTVSGGNDAIKTPNLKKMRSVKPPQKKFARTQKNEEDDEIEWGEF
ncbi:hypothetical protein, partial [Enterovibrio norvegicus]